MTEQLMFPGLDAARPRFLDQDYRAQTQKALELLACFQAARFAVYGKKPGHKNFHPMAPTRGLYNCPLLHQERFQDRETAQRIADHLARQNPGWDFQVRAI